MEKWDNSKYQKCLQQLQTGEYDQPIEQLVDTLHAQFHALYEDFMVEDVENRAVTRAEFDEANRIYFELGCALIVKTTNTRTEPANADTKPVQEEPKGAEGGEANQKSMDWANEDDSKPSGQKSAPKVMPYHVLCGIITPVLELPQCNLISDLIINEIIHKCELVLQRMYRAEDFSEREEKFLVATIESKLDSQTRMMWNWDLADSASEPGIETMIAFLRKREKRITATEKRAAREFERKFLEEVQTTDICCPYCRGKHKMCRCEKFKNLELGDRWDVIERLRMCVNCFSRAHLTSNCREGACRKCRAMHNSLMCSQSYHNN